MSEEAPRVLFFGSLLILAFGYGVVAEHFSWFPVPMAKRAVTTGAQLLEESGAVLPWYYKDTTETRHVQVHDAAAVAPGLRLISGLAEDETSQVKVIDESGRVIHSWSIDWFKLWPSPDHLSSDLVPKSNAGLVHGVAVAANGDLVFNFEELGLMRLDPCGKVRWRLPYRTHHSIHIDEDGKIWVPGVITRHERMPELPNYTPPFEDFRILEVSSDGQITRDISVQDLLVRNGLKGLLYMSSILNRSTRVSDDTLHLNDIETFPRTMRPGLFQPGDVMISLRNINAVLVFDPQTWKVKFTSVGQVLRQHDPDFVDGDTISVFDNNNLALWPPDATRPDPAGHHSRVVRLSASGEVGVPFAGSAEAPFFTDIMGAHQHLGNGNLLVVESIAGRVLEVDSHGEPVWEYLNLVGNGHAAVIGDALALPASFDERFFRTVTAECDTTE